MAAASIAAGHGVEIAATTRRPDKVDALTAAGVDHALLDTGGSLAASVRAIWPDGPDHVLDLVGASTAVDSLQLVRRGGTVCVAGSLSGWLDPGPRTDRHDPVRDQAHRVPQRHLKGSAGTAVLQRVVHEVEGGAYRPNIDRVFGLDDLAAAHRQMEDNQATGKLVMVPQPRGQRPT